MSCARNGSKSCGQGSHATNERVKVTDDGGVKKESLLTYSVAAGANRSPITRYRPDEIEIDETPRLRVTGTRSPELVMNCSLPGDIVGITGGVNGPCEGGD